MIMVKSAVMGDIHINKAGVEELQLIHDMAEIVFRHTYASILSPEQMEYMMDWMYSLPNLEKQLAEIFLSGFMGCIASCGKALAHGETQIAVAGGCIQLDQVILIFIHYCGCFVYESQYCCFVHSSLSLTTAGSDG